MQLIKKLLKNEEGVALIEYALIILFIAIALIGALGSLGEGLKEYYDYIAGKVEESIQ